MAAELSHGTLALPEVLTEDQQTIACLCALVTALQRNVMSGDLWWLAHNNARSMVSEVGVPSEVYDSVMARLENARKRQRSRNPMSGMFA